MAKLGTIDFDDRIIDALRDGQIVVFAGAGVSMGPPSNLSSFWKLTSDIAQGSGYVPSEPLDRFLGQLHHRNVAVHERAAQLLSPIGSAPNALHYDLLRLFRTADCVRLVTTNFDQHFITAANDLFGTVPDVYRAPALPLGYDFSGIVHVHGALPQTQDLVLTDADFGRAYLTEGWARRFLVDVFRRYTVLFVGYSHNDVVMNYLARALPADSVAGRFALTEEEGNWDLLGITPVRFEKCSGMEPFKELFEGVHRLAERNLRGALDWQSRLAELGNRPPPTDEEAISEVEQALREVHTTRFLINVVRDPEWLQWLSRRKHLDALFGSVNLSERDELLAQWFAQHFSIEYPDVVLGIIAAHGLQLNPVLWLSIGREIGVMIEKPLEVSALKRWISILLASVPKNANSHVLMWLADRCASQGCVEQVLAVFMRMSEHRLSIRSGFIWPDDESNEHRRLEAECPLLADHWLLNDVWTKHLKPFLPHIGQQLLSSIALRLEIMHAELTVWGKASRKWDPLSFRRSAIEPHEQDKYPDSVDVLIDAMRDALAQLAVDSPTLLNSWIERLDISNSSLLRRLAIHATTMHPDLSPEQSLNWLLAHIGHDRVSVHHEVYRAVALNYPSATELTRKTFVEAILAHSLPASDNLSAEKRTARLHFDWLSWLHCAKPDCALVCDALSPLKEQYPEWRSLEHPDFTHWMGSAEWVGSESPWSVEQLLACEPREQLNELLSFRDGGFDRPSREGLLSNIHEACKQNTRWAFMLGQVLTEQVLWSSDLWPVLLRGLWESELSKEGWQELLNLVSNPVLQLEHSYDIANLLYSLVRDGGKPFALDLLEEACIISLSVWQAIDVCFVAEDVAIENWLSRAINHPAGLLVEFWINGLSLFVHDKVGTERIMPESYRQWFTMVVQDVSIKGDMGVCLLASQTAFLFGLDEVWTRHHIVPLFSDLKRETFVQVWDGFLMWGRLYPALADAMLPAFVAAMPRLDADLSSNRQRFIEFYTALAAFYVSDPTHQLLPMLFQHGSLEDRLVFASQLRNILSRMQQPAKKQVWGAWLHGYWQARLQGVFAGLDETEIGKMLEWLPHLGDEFPEAVALAIRSPKIRIESSHVFYDLCNSELVTRFPTETAELLVYLSSCTFGFNANDLIKIERRLPLIPENVRSRLDEAFARAGLMRRE